MIRTRVGIKGGLSLALACVIALGAWAVFLAQRPATASPGAAEPISPSRVVNVVASVAPVQAGAAVAIVATEDRRNAAADFLVKEFAVRCLMDSFVTVHEDPAKVKALDAKIDARGVMPDWVDDQRSAYAGKNVDAVRAFEAVAAFGDEHSVWIVVGGNKPRAMELRAKTTPAGRVVWSPTNHVTPSSDC
jgi:hypothetical protein